MASSSQGKTLKRADPSTIQDKFLVGYQGWFTCPGDGPPLDPGHHGWLHWFNYPIPDGGRPNTDLWPDVSEYSPSELFPAPGLKFATGDQAFLFSSRNARTVERHFHWMALHGVDGAFLQRFLGQCDLEGGNENIRNQRDEVGDRVREAAEKEGRVFTIMYDISGVAPDRIQRVLEQDWMHLVHKKGILDSPNYLREKGKAVVTLWGFGMGDTGHDPATVRAVTSFIRSNTPGGAYIMGGGPAYWRTSTNDADRNPEFVNVWLEEFDAISPWTIGRFGSPEHADRYAEENVKGDLELIRKRNEEAESGVPGRRHIDFIPVIFPGGSGFNLSEGKWGWNDIPRRGGQFLWRQLWNMRRLGIRTMYGAMWDEYDEGTAYMPIVSKKRQVPVHDKYNFMALDEDGFDLPPDWYMRIAGFAGESLRGDRMMHETFPSKELQDYWSTRPRYEEKESDNASASGSNQKKSESWEEWDKLTKEKEGKDEPPPPPYSLEAEEPPVPPRPSATGALNAVPSSPERSVIQQLPAQQPAAPQPSAPQPSPIQQPPIAPLSSRPSMSRPAGSSPVNGPPSAPPPVPVNSRPKPGTSSYSPTSIPPTSISSLADDFSRQRISSVSPRLEPPPLHPAHPSASRPSSPAKKPASPGTCLNPAMQGYPQSSYQPSQSTYGAAPNHSMFPAAGYAPSVGPRPQHGNIQTSGPWSAAPWPPPEWGVQPSSPTSQPPHTFPTYPAPEAQFPSYSSTYATGYSSPSPPLRPRPSTSSAHSYSHSPSHSSSPSPKPPSPFRPPDATLGGGFQFPQAQPSVSQEEFYAYPPQPHQIPQPYNQYGSSTPPLHFPGTGPTNSAYPSYAPASSPPPLSQYGGYPSGPNPYPQPSNTGGQQPYLGNSNQYSGYPGSSYNSRPSGSSGLLGSAMHTLGSVTGQSGRMQNLAQTGLSTGGKLLNKFKK